MVFEFDFEAAPGCCDRCGGPSGVCGCIPLAAVKRGLWAPGPFNGEGWSDIPHHHDAAECAWCGAVWVDDEASGSRVMNHEDDCLFIQVEEAFAEPGDD